MAYAKKYEIQFYTAENKLCYVEFFIDGYSGSVTQLTPASSPFVLKEYNTDDDIFKPVRGQEASISFISSDTAYSVSIDDFLANTDTYSFIRFKYDSSSLIYWTGYLLQDDFQESWENTKHIITLRANEGLGLLKNELLSDDSSELIGDFDINDLLIYCIQNSLPEWGRFNVINNLYHSSMDDTLPQPSIKQCRVDARTFSVGDGEYEDKYTVLEKINKAFNQTIFQYKGRWHIVRIEEFYTSFSNNLRQKEFYTLGFPDQWTTTNLRYDLEVGVNETIKPIEPGMLRMINRITKSDRVSILYNYPSELFPNQSFERGSLLTSSSSLRTYTINNWTAYKGSKTSPTPSTRDFFRKDVIDTYNNVIDSYMYLQTETSYDENWAQSESVKVSKNDVMDISFLWRWSESSAIFNPIPNFRVAQVFFTKNTAPFATFYLNNSGEWVSGTHNSDVNKYINIKPDPASVDERRYMERSILTKPMPASGEIKILLTNGPLNPYSHNWSQLKINLQGAINNLTTLNIAGNYERYIKPEDIKSNFEDEIFLDDLPNYNFMGAFLESDGATLTTPEWYRYRFADESYGFKNQNLIANYQRSRFPRNKIDGTFYGLAQGSNVVGLINTIKFVDDDPNKVYAIANMKEIDFAAETWSATLVEVFDETKDALFVIQATLETGLQSGKAYLPLDMVDTSNFILLTNDKIKYIGTESIIVDIVGTIIGSVTSATVPQDFIISITKNTSTFLDSETYEVAVNPTAINFTLNGNNVTLNTNDTIEFKNDALTPPITVTSGSITISVTNYGYPGYEKKYIYK
jgi:hypothetical protein